MDTVRDHGLLEGREARLAYVRAHFRPYWVPIESGGVFLLASADDEENRRALEELERRLPEIATLPEDRRAFALAELIAADAGYFFKTATLAPGTYELDNYHVTYAGKDGIVFDSNGSPPTPYPPKPRFAFGVKPEHLKLLRHINTRHWYAVVELMDPKRPYGDMTYYFLDMMNAIGDPPPARDARGQAELSPERKQALEALHREMLFAIQAFWTLAK